MPDPTPEAITSFISRWEKSGGSEKANYALFLTELCDHILHVPHPEPAGPDNAKNRYVFERAVTHKEAGGSSATGYLDLYKAGCFVLETKEGTYLKATAAGTLLDFIPSSGTSGPAATSSAKPPAPTEKLPWPETIPAPVTTLQKLHPTHGPDPETLSALFGKKSPKRTQQITEILETLKALGH